MTNSACICVCTSLSAHVCMCVCVCVCVCSQTAMQACTHACLRGLPHGHGENRFFVKTEKVWKQVPERKSFENATMTSLYRTFVWQLGPNFIQSRLFAASSLVMNRKSWWSDTSWWSENSIHFYEEEVIYRNISGQRLLWVCLIRDAKC